MHPDYSDIRSRLGVPIWWYHQSAAVPRYDVFHPSLCDVYASHVALLSIRCQACRRLLSVGVSLCRMDLILARIARNALNGQANSPTPEITLPTRESAGNFDLWGDPPIHYCIGDTMMSDLARINQFWMRGEGRIWNRHREYEFDYSAQLVASDSPC